MNNIILILLLSLISFNLQASEDCLEDLIPTGSTQLTKQVTAISEASCSKKLDDSFTDLITGCLNGGKKAGIGFVQGFVELVKMLLIEAPSAAWKEAKEQIDKLLAGDLNPVEMSLRIARLNLSSQSDLWKKAREYWDNFIAFSKDLKNQLVKEIKGFPCLPLYKQSEIVCQGVTNIFLFTVSPAKFVQGARWGVNTARAMKNFITETKAIQGLEKSSLATRLQQATMALKESHHAKKPLLMLKNAELHQVELPDGTIVLRYTKNVVDKKGVLQRVTQDVPVDAKTLAIDANSTIGKEILNTMVKEKAGKGGLIFVDVNHLGKTNYFAGGTQAGDQYLTSVGESLRKGLRPGDMVFKNGGDELVVVLGSNSPQVIKQISQRMVNEVDHNPQIRHIFRQEVKAAVQKYKELNKVSSADKLPASIKKTLSASETELARKNFKKFKETKLQEYKKDFTEQATYRGSISIGSSLVKPNEDLSMVLKRAEEQAARVKAEYKLRMGHDISKYNIEAIQLENIRRWAPPQALEPR